MKRWLIVWLMMCGVGFGQVVPPGGDTIDIDVSTLVTNMGCTVDGQAVSNGAAIVTHGGMSGATVTSIVVGIVSTGACARADSVTGPQSNLIATALQPAATNTLSISLTNQLTLATNAVWVQTTNVSYYSAAPLAYKVTLNNTSAMTWTNTYSPWSNCASVEALSTGVVTHLYIWPTNASCSMEFIYTATGSPVNAFPSGAIWVTGGVFSATAGTIGKSNLVVVKHTPYLYMMFALTNAQTSSWGTP